MIEINESIYLSEIKPDDKAAYLEHFKDKIIYEQTVPIPHPYTEADADEWIKRVTKQTQIQGQPVSWAIRKLNGFLIGGIGFDSLEIGKTHQAELGYWLAKPYRGQGIMTECVKKACEFAFANFGLMRITAGVFDFNTASCRVLEKSGFQLEGVLRKHYLKDKRFIDCKLYARLKP